MIAGKNRIKRIAAILAVSLLMVIAMIFVSGMVYADL